jgi:hypothetical protein
MNTHTRYPTAGLSPAEKRFESAAEISARIAAAQAEAKRVGCPHGAQFYKCECCGAEWDEHNSYPAGRPCEGCGEWVDAQDNPLRKAWYAGFRRAQELAE